MEWALILLFLGFMFVLAEIFFPSFGLLSIMAAASLIGSVVFAFQQGTLVGASFLGGIVVSLPILIVGGFKVLPKTAIGQRLILSGPSRKGGGDATADPNEGLLRRTGVTTTPLRPAGIAEIDGRRIDVVADGEMIAAREPVRVIKVEGNRIVVERYDAEPANGAGNV